MKKDDSEPAAPAAATDSSIEQAGSPMKPLYFFVLLPMILLVAWGIFGD